VFFFILSSLLAQVFISIRHVASLETQLCFKTLVHAARTYALSRLNRKLLRVFLTLGMVHVGLGIVLMYDSRDRGELYPTRAIRDSFI
jgi:hypothetical protein